MADPPLRPSLKRSTSLKARELSSSVPRRIDAHLSLRRNKRTASRRHEEDLEEKRARVTAFVDLEGKPCEFSSFLPQVQPDSPSSALSDLLKNPRYRILKEIKDSERTYLTFLQSVALLFYQPCKTSLKTSTPILPAPVMESLFGNILDVVELSSQVLQAIEVLVHPRTWDTDKSTVGDFFLRLLDGDLPRVYSEYVEGYGKRLKSLAATPEQFNMFRRSQEGSQLCGNHTLSSLLITPIQRIPRYVLLLRDLYRSTSAEHEDHTLLPHAIREFERLTAKLDAVKRKADTKDQFAVPLQSLAKKGDAELRTMLLRSPDIEAAGYLVELHEGEFMPLFCVVFSEMIVGAQLKKDGTITRVRWRINLNSAFLTTGTRDEPLPRDIIRKYGVTDDFLVLTELRTIPQEPFSSSFTFVLYPTKAPYDMGYWYNSILTVVSSLWFDNKVLLSNSYRFRQHLEANLFPMSQWKLIQLAATTQSYEVGDIILQEGESSDKLYMILEGSVKTIKPSVNVNITLARLRKNEFFGEFGYITFQRNASASSVIASKRTTVATISYSTLTSILLSDPGMMYRFFRFQCCIMANRLVLQLFTQLNSSQLKQKRRDSAALQRNLTRLYDPTCLDRVDPDEASLSDEDSPVEEHSEEVDLYIPPPPRAIADAPAEHPLTKKYSHLLTKHGLQEHVLMELNVTLIRYSKSDARGKFLFLDQHICLMTKSGFSQKSHLIRFADIRQVLENENQHMLVIIVSKPEVEELHCSFDTHSDYCRINSLLQTMSPVSSSAPAASSSDPFKGLDFEEDEWNLLLSRVTSMKVPKGHYLTKLATTTQTVFQVVSGSFIIRTNLSATASGLCPHAGPGAVFGDLTFIQGGISTADIIADTDDCEVLCFEKSIIDELTHTDPMLAGKFYRFLASKMVHRFLELQLQLLI